MSREQEQLTMVLHIEHKMNKLQLLLDKLKRSLSHDILENAVVQDVELKELIDDNGCVVKNHECVLTQLENINDANHMNC